MFRRKTKRKLLLRLLMMNLPLLMERQKPNRREKTQLLISLSQMRKLKMLKMLKKAPKKKQLRAKSRPRSQRR